jgi:hypothetical protein
MYSYDALDPAATLTQTIAGLTPTLTLSQQYDADGNRTQVAASIGETADYVNDYLYDNLGRMTDVKQQG